MEATALLIKKKPVLPALASRHGLEKSAKKVSLNSSKRVLLSQEKGLNKKSTFKEEDCI